MKANDKGTDPEQLVAEIYRTASEMRDNLSNEQLLLIEQWVSAYKKVSEQKLVRIKREVKMAYVATTITEHIQYESEIKGAIKGVIKGKIEGKIENLEALHAEGILSKELFEKKVAPLRQELKNILNEKEGADQKKTDHLTVVQ